MSTGDRRITAGLVIAICGIVLIAEVVVFMNYGTAHIRWTHAGVLAAAAAAFALGALAYLRGTRDAAPVRTGEEINTAYYLSMAAWKPPVVFAGRQS